MFSAWRNYLNHWGRVTHICVGNLTIIGSDNGLSPGRHQAIIWTNAGILLFGPLGTNFSEFWIEFHTFSFKKMHFKRSSAKWRPFCLGLNVLERQRRFHWIAADVRTWMSDFRPCFDRLMQKDVTIYFVSNGAHLFCTNQSIYTTEIPSM